MGAKKQSSQSDEEIAEEEEKTDLARSSGNGMTHTMQVRYISALNWSIKYVLLEMTLVICELTFYFHYTFVTRRIPE